MEFDIWKLLAGLVLFLLAMSIIEESIRAIAGNRMKAFISRNTESPLRGLLSGTLSTALLQSSSLVSLLVLAFIGARLIPLRNALLIIFGANLGTTATGWIVTVIGFKLDLDVISLPMIGIGGLVWVASGHRGLGRYGKFALGIGLLLFALQFMKTAVTDAQSIVSPELFAGLAAWQFALFGVGFSAIVQSSSAVMVLTLSALHAGLIDLPGAAALMIGADLGTTTTVVLGALGGSASKKRVAAGHVIFNVVTDSLAFMLLIPLVALVASIQDPLLALVAFHSLFNVLGVALCTPFVQPLANFLERRFLQTDVVLSKFLDPSMQALVEVATTALRRETKRLAELVFEQNRDLFKVVDGKVKDKEVYNKTYTATKQLEAEILEFSLDLEFNDANGGEKASVERLLTAARSLLLSSKLCKDNINDLNDMAEYLPALFTSIVEIQEAFYARFAEVTEDYFALHPEQFDPFISMARDGHDHIHELIYDAIRRDQLPADKVSTALNLNREFYNSNTALLAGLAILTGTAGQTPETAERSHVVAPV